MSKTKPLNSFSTWEGQVVKLNESGLQKPINIFFYINQDPRVQNGKDHEFIQEISPQLVSMEKRKLRMHMTPLIATLIF